MSEQTKMTKKTKTKKQYYKSVKKKLGNTLIQPEFLLT